MTGRIKTRESGGMRSPNPTRLDPTRHDFRKPPDPTPTREILKTLVNSPCMYDLAQAAPVKMVDRLRVTLHFLFTSGIFPYRRGQSFFILGL